ncbi:hypothetical protein ACFUC1_05370 [Pedococcus sp. NPDC057267]|uniref:hypothetical protein n=1 Tax=Pedococcus sp. NPDC057267 TaxID=3346077 RepID=UPI00363A5ED0
MDELLGQHEFLVACDYGMGGLWGVVIAPSAGDILAKYPELVVADSLPSWMSEEDLQRKVAEPLLLDDEPPQGLLSVVIDDRGRP